MLKRFTFPILIVSLFALNSGLQARQAHPGDEIKKHFNKMVQQVEEADSPEVQRKTINRSLDKMITAVERVEKMSKLDEKEREALASFRKDLADKKDHLNGLNGFAPIANKDLSSYAQFIQQDLEQADTITLSLTTVLLIVIILLLI